MEIKKIGILTSGGDAPGMNAAIRSVVRCAAQNGIEVIGIERAYAGLMNSGKTRVLTPADVSGIESLGGTILFSARCPEFKEREGVLKARDNCISLGIDGLVVIGGDGSFRGAADLSKEGIPCVGLPGTIDNDISCSDYTIGYDTAMNTAMEMVDKIKDTMHSHDRCAVVEVMGRNAGWIAINVGIACGASYVVMPELGLDKDDVVAKLKEEKAAGKTSFLVVCGEHTCDCDQLAKDIEAETGIETRASILGHLQRGGAPTLTDRVVASRMGEYAVDLLKKGIGNRVVGQQNGQIVDFDIQEALKMKKPVPVDMIELAKKLAF